MRIWQFEKSLNPHHSKLFRKWRRDNAQQIYEIKQTFNTKKLDSQDQMVFEKAIVTLYLKQFYLNFDK